MSPEAKCGKGIDDIGNDVSDIETEGSVGTGSGNSVSCENELNCGDCVVIDDIRFMWPDWSPNARDWFDELMSNDRHCEPFVLICEMS